MKMMRSVSSLSSTGDEEDKRPLATAYQICTNSLDGTRRRDFVWVDEFALEGVKGAELWVLAERNFEFHNVSSVLLGLEGTAPNMKSPFGVTHDASGASAKISALGNRKWSSYRKNHAHQVPSSEGGMRVRIDRSTFQDLLDLCESIDLVDPSVDVSSQQLVFSRCALAQRHEEKELFKELLAGNGREARQALECARKRHAADLRRPDRVFKAIHAGEDSRSGSDKSLRSGGASPTSSHAVGGGFSHARKLRR